MRRKPYAYACAYTGKFNQIDKRGLTNDDLFENKSDRFVVKRSGQLDRMNFQN